MLCSKCYKEIPAGKEVRRASSLPFWGGAGSKVVCRKCSIKEDKKSRIFWGIWLLFFVLMNLVSLLIIIAYRKK